MQVMTARTGISSTPRPGMGSAVKMVMYVGASRLSTYSL